MIRGESLADHDGAAKGEHLNLIVTDLSELLEATTNRDRAERDSRTKDEFLAMLAHELRNPLGAITQRGQRARAARTPTGSAATPRHEVIARQVDHISRLIDDLLDVERVVSGKIRLNRQPLDLAEAVQRAVATFDGGRRTGSARSRSAPSRCGSRATPSGSSRS